MNAEEILIRTLTVENKKLNHDSINLIQILIQKAQEIILKEPTLLRIEPPIIAVGDIHGQFEDLLWIFQQTGFPPSTSYLFLGDYVDRGLYSVECLSLLLSLKVKHPENVYLLRGNHECTLINQKYGFLNECKKRFNITLWRKFSAFFDCLPLAAVIGDKIFCCHGGLSPELKFVKQIDNIKRPYSIQNLSGIVNDLLWSDPSRFHSGWRPNKFRSVSYTFGSDVIEKFLSENGFQLIVRAHQLINSGYQIFANGKLISIFSAPNYCNNHMNEGALLQIDHNLKCSIIRLKLKRKPSGMEVLVRCPYENNILDCIKINMEKSFEFQYGRTYDTSLADVSTYKMDIGIFKTALSIFCTMFILNLALKIFKIIISHVLPW